MKTATVNRKKVLDDYRRFFPAAALERMHSEGLDIVEVERDGAFIFDEKGRRYIDCIASASVYNLGRRPRGVTTAFKKALRETDQGNFPMISREKAALAAKIAAFAPSGLECVVFSVTRGESVDFACKLVRGATGRSGLVTVDGSWFGQTGFALSLSERADREMYGPLIPAVDTIPFGDFSSAARAITDTTAAVILEPLQAENGCRAAYPEYLAEIRRLCDARGAALIFDETQSGLGRTGRKFFLEYSGILPDVLVMGEALGAGVFPIAATVFTKKLNRFMNRHPLIHLSTFGGADLGCMAGIAALDLYERLKPWENADTMGRRLRSGIERALRGRRRPNGMVSGAGLLLAIDLGSPENALSFCRAAARSGILVKPGDVDASSVLIRPSLLITPTQANEIIGAVEKAAADIKFI